jgi:hypothetical protein
VNPGGLVVTTLVCFFISHARLRVHWAPGIPHALSGAEDHAQLGRIAPRECGCVSEYNVIACDKREAFAQGSNATKQSIISLRRPMDCFAGACNDGTWLLEN